MNDKRMITGGFIILFLWCFSCLSASAEIVSLSLLDAVDIAFAQNSQYELSMWENKLLEKEKQLQQKHTPKLSFTGIPISLGSGKNKIAEGLITLTLPISDHTKITGNLNANFSELTPETKPSGYISFDYQFFAPKKTEEAVGIDPEITTANALVLNVAQTFITLRKYIDNLDLEQFRVQYLTKAYQAAEVTKDTGESQRLQTQIRSTEQKISDLTINIKQQNRELCHLLNQPDTVYDPLLKPIAYILDYDQHTLIDLALAHSSKRISALNNLAQAENQLTLVKQSLGWNIETSARLNWNQPEEISSKTTWSLSLTASKQLYPQSLELEKAELKLAQAELNLADTEQQIFDEIIQRLETMEMLLDKRETIKTSISDEYDNLVISNKYYQAGLVTEIKLLAHELNLLSFDCNLQHNYYDYLLNTLQLLDKCGLNLKEEIVIIMKEVGSCESN